LLQYPVSAVNRAFRDELASRAGRWTHRRPLDRAELTTDHAHALRAAEQGATVPITRRRESLSANEPPIRANGSSVQEGSVPLVGCAARGSGDDRPCDAFRAAVARSVAVSREVEYGSGNSRLGWWYRRWCRWGFRRRRRDLFQYQEHWWPPRACLHGPHGGIHVGRDNGLLGRPLVDATALPAFALATVFAPPHIGYPLRQSTAGADPRRGKRSAAKQALSSLGGRWARVSDPALGLTEGLPSATRAGRGSPTPPSV
jgi:hypothetical protein